MLYFIVRIVLYSIVGMNPIVYEYAFTYPNIDTYAPKHIHCTRVEGHEGGLSIYS